MGPRGRQRTAQTLGCLGGVIADGFPRYSSNLWETARQTIGVYLAVSLKQVRRLRESLLAWALISVTAPFTCFSAADRIRTCNLHLVEMTLYQLSYGRTTTPYHPA
ncbi:MAG: hypothetical protein JWM00_395 [Candidatus Saccharibacteria bacterium]|nr:hypothetical protein [Candidatus Saccharibacteria bacterium]